MYVKPLFYLQPKMFGENLGGQMSSQTRLRRKLDVRVESGGANVGWCINCAPKDERPFVRKWSVWEFVVLRS